MSRQAIDIAASVHQNHPLDPAIRWMLGGLLVFLPAAFGTVDGWSESIVAVIIGAIALCLAIRSGSRRVERPAFTWAYLPLALFILLVGFQLLPLPAALVKLISPHTWELKSRLLSDVPDSQSALNWMTLSFYPLATRQLLRIVLIATVVFVTVVTLYRRSEHIKNLLTLLALVGGGAAALAVAQDLTGADAIYWLVSRPNYLATAGPFVNYNNYAQFANLSLGAALGLILAQLAEVQQTLPSSSPPVRKLTDEERLMLMQTRWLIGVIVLIAISIFLSQSRGGMISLIAAAAVTGGATSASRRLAGRGWVLIILALAVLAALLYVGIDAVLDRLATLRNAQVAAKARFEVARDVIALLIPKFPVLGTGLGTHEWVYPMVSRQTFAGLAGHVENEYVQVLEEVGGLGAALLAAFAVIIAACWLRAVRRLRRPVRSAAFGLGFGLVAILVHSLSDFGQRIPAVACLTAVTCGLLVNLARSIREPAPAETAPARRPDYRRGLAFVGGVVAVMMFCWMLDGSGRCAMGQWRWKQTTELESDLAVQQWQGTSVQFADLVSHAESAAQWEPDNITYRHWLNIYRWYSLTTSDPKTGHALMDEQTLGSAGRIVEELHRARVACPTFGPTYCVAGQIELLHLNRVDTGERHIRTGYELTRSHPQVCYLAGLLDAREGKWESAQEKLSRALLLGYSRQDVFDVCLRDADRPDVALALVRGNLTGLYQLAERLKQMGRHGDVIAAAQASAVEIIKTQAAESSASPDILASMGQLLVEQRDLDTAADYYRRALASEYGRVDWHFNLAQALAQSGKIDEAEREARVCLRLRPEMAAAREFLTELASHPNNAATR